MKVDDMVMGQYLVCRSNLDLILLSGISASASSNFRFRGTNLLFCINIPKSFTGNNNTFKYIRFGILVWLSKMITFLWVPRRWRQGVTNVTTSLPNYIMPCKIWGSTTLVLKIPFFWNVTLCCWTRIPCSLNDRSALIFRVKRSIICLQNSRNRSLNGISTHARRISASAGTSVWTSNITRLIMLTTSFLSSDVWTVTEEMHFHRAVAGYREADHKCNDHIWGQLRIPGITTMQNKIVKIGQAW